LTCSKIRPTYSPTTPTLTMMNPARTINSTARLVYPGTRFWASMK
jgi:hypothetical protein